MTHVDSPAFNLISFCSGAGALDIGVTAALSAHGIGARHVAYSERESASIAALRARMEDKALEPAPIWGANLETFPGAAFRGLVDGIAAGFPCQPHSVAGKREGRDDDRNLLPEILKQADASGTWLLFLENVSGLKKEFDYIAALLLQRGWNSEWGTLYASAVGANHRRDRWFCVAYRKHLPDGPQRWLESWRGSYAPAIYGPMPGDADGQLLADDIGQPSQRRGKRGKLDGARGAASGQAREQQRGGDAAGDFGNGLLAGSDDAGRGEHQPGRGTEGGTAAGGDGHELAAGARGGFGIVREPSGSHGQPDGGNGELGHAHQPGPQRWSHDAGKHAGQCAAGPAGAGLVGDATGDDERRNPDGAHGPGIEAGRPGGPVADTDGGGCGKPDVTAPTERDNHAGLVGGSEGVDHAAGAQREGREGCGTSPDIGRRPCVPFDGIEGVANRQGGNADGPGPIETGRSPDHSNGGDGLGAFGIPIFAPGPNDPDWLRILDACPWLAPALPISPLAMRAAWGAIFGGFEMEAEPGLCGVANGLESSLVCPICLNAKTEVTSGHERTISAEVGTEAPATGADLPNVRKGKLPNRRAPRGHCEPSQNGDLPLPEVPPSSGCGERFPDAQSAEDVPSLPAADHATADKDKVLQPFVRPEAQSRGVCQCGKGNPDGLPGLLGGDSGTHPAGAKVLQPKLRDETPEFGLDTPMGMALCLESSRADMLRITGNGVVWQQAAWAYYQILDRIFTNPTPS